MAKKAKTAAKKPAAKKSAAKKPAVKKAAMKKPAAKKPAKKSGAKRTSGLNQTTYSLSPELQAIVGAKSLTRPQIVKKMWEYIKSRKCQDAKNKRLIVPDSKLAAVIGSKPVDMLKLAGCLSKHIK